MFLEPPCMCVCGTGRVPSTGVCMVVHGYTCVYMCVCACVHAHVCQHPLTETPGQ